MSKQQQQDDIFDKTVAQLGLTEFLYLLHLAHEKGIKNELVEALERRMRRESGAYARTNMSAFNTGTLRKEE